MSASLVADSGVLFLNAAMDLSDVCCYLGWTLLLSKTGETQQTRVRSHISPEHAQELLGQLEAINQLLLRAGGSVSHGR
jgi:hypothetical protein